MRWIRRDSWVMYLLPYIIVFLLIMVAIEIKDHFSDGKPKGYLEKIFYPKQYWQKQIKYLESEKRSIESSLSINDIDLTSIKSSRDSNIEKNVSSAKVLGMDAHQARLDAEEETNKQIREINLMRQLNQEELLKIMNQIESAKRELTNYE